MKHIRRRARPLENLVNFNGAPAARSRQVRMRTSVQEIAIYLLVDRCELISLYLSAESL